MNKAKSLTLLLGTLAAAVVLSAPFAASASAAAPSVTIDPVSAPTATTAHFSGEVNPGDLETSCAFDYVTDAVFQQGRKEVQQLAITAQAGTYKLSFEGEETAPIQYGASAAKAQEALEALVAIGSGGVTVSGGPLKSGPFTIVFSAAANVPELGIEAAGLFNISAGGLQVIVEGATPGFAGAQSVSCADTNGTNLVPVEADATGLEPLTTYHLRLRASNADGSDEAEAATFITETAPPQVVATSVSGVDDTSATLEAKINPGSAATTYHFEYLTLAEYEAATPGEEFADATSTPESASIGADNQAHGASATIAGLDPFTAYRFRVVATNEKALGGVAGPATAFKTLPVTGPESCPNAAVRAQQGSTYLPECRAYEIVNTPGLDLGDVNRIPFMSDDGNAIAYLSVGAANDALGAGVSSISLARRGVNGWESTSADPFATGVSNAGTGFTGVKAFSTDLSRLVVDALLPMNTADTDGISDYYRVDIGVGTSTLMTQKENQFPIIMGGASLDLERIVFIGASGAVNGIWVSDGTNRELMSKYPNEEAVLPGQAAFSSPQFERGKDIGGSGNTGTAPFVQRGGAHGVSDDARRVYFTDFSGKIYVRDVVPSTPRTLAVSVSSRTGDVGTSYPATFISATHDGGSAYFHSSAQLTDGATPGGGIYRFDLATDSVTQVTPDAGPGGFDIRGSIVSDDQSHVYFTSNAALAGDAQAGDTNVYAWTSGDGFRFIAKVGNNTPLTRVTPDGRYLLLMTSTSIDGAPNNDSQALYRYDYANDEVVCVSCRPDGTPSRGAAYIDAQSVGQPGASLIRNRALSFDGRVAFTSTDRLVAGDQTSAMDVYLYHDGTVSLLSSGREETGSFVGDISDDGKSVSILTRAPLVGADRDAKEYDAYDAYVGGGFLEAPPAPAPCEGEACRGSASSTPGAAAPTTPSFIGPGNPRPCAKGKVRRNGRCEKRHKHRKKHRSKVQKRDANANGRAGR